MFTNPTSPASDTMAETAPIRKFMFDRSFEPGVAHAPERNAKPVLMKPEQIEQLKREAYDQGFAAGKQNGLDEQIERQNTTLARAEEQVTRLVQNLAALAADQEARLRKIIMAIARKILPSFTARQGVEEISTLLSTVIAEMRHEPRLVVRVNEAEFDAINTKLEQISVQKAYSGKLVVLADAEIGRGDCRVEWADGGTERNALVLWKEIETIIAPQDTANTPSHQE